MKAKPRHLVFSCEHASSAIPKYFRFLFKNRSFVLNTHKSCDWGAKEIAVSLAKKFNAPLTEGQYSRLLIDLNRDYKTEEVFSRYAQELDQKKKDLIFKKYYSPYLKKLETQLGSTIKRKGSVTHLSVHSFTPRFEGRYRNASVGILFHPRSANESEFAKTLSRRLQKAKPSWKIRLNYPYKGSEGGLVNRFRKNFGTQKYIGIEIEINQRLLRNKSKEELRSISTVLHKALDF